MDQWTGPFVVKKGHRLDQFTREGARWMRRVLLHAFYLYVAVGTTIGPERRSVQITIEQGLNQAVRASPS